MLPQYPDFSLSLEQQFDMRKFQAMVKDLSRLEIEELVLMLLRQKMAHENISRGLIKEMVKADGLNLSSYLNVNHPQKLS